VALTRSTEHGHGAMAVEPGEEMLETYGDACSVPFIVGWSCVATGWGGAQKRRLRRHGKM